MQARRLDSELGLLRKQAEVKSDHVPGGYHSDRLLALIAQMFAKTRSLPKASQEEACQI